MRGHAVCHQPGVSQYQLAGERESEKDGEGKDGKKEGVLGISCFASICHLTALDLVYPDSFGTEQRGGGMSRPKQQHEMWAESPIQQSHEEGIIETEKQNSELVVANSAKRSGVPTQSLFPGCLAASTVRP